MVSALHSTSSGPGSTPSGRHFVVFLGKTLHSHSASLHTGVQMGNDKLELASHPAGSRNTPSRFMLQRAEWATWLLCRQPFLA